MIWRLLVFILTVGLSCLSSFTGEDLRQTTTPDLTLTPLVEHSLFQDDTCAPPCWFGITSGISTSEDVQALFQTHRDWFTSEDAPKARGHFDPQNDLLTEGLYTFHLLPGNNYADPAPSRLYIHHGKVYRLSIWMNRRVTLAQTLDILGMPDLVHFTPNTDLYFLASRPAMDLIYLKLRMRVSFASLRQHGSCSIDSILQDMGVYKVRYYSAEAAEALNNYTAFANPRQAALIAFEHLEQNVPLETWKHWLQGEDHSNCTSVQLPPMPMTNEAGSALPLSVAPNLTLRSPFMEDTCTPPCWFGLVTGQSTEENVIALIQSPLGLFDFNFASKGENRIFDFGSERVSNGTYFLTWGDFPRDDYDFPEVGSEIAIELENGVISHISAMMNRIVFLKEALDSLGTPDRITFSVLNDPEFRPAAYLTLGYSDLHIAVYLMSDQFDCDFVSLGEQFWIEKIVYYSHPEDENQLIQDENLPSSVWESWLKSNCFTQ